LIGSVRFARIDRIAPREKKKKTDRAHRHALAWIALDRRARLVIPPGIPLRF
jgi:hypothetical protein